MSTHAANHGQIDELDPHGAEAGHHSHVIIGVTQLRAVLVALLFFTALTVGLAQLEIWISGQLDIVLPHWVNIAVAMSIAVVKSLLVLAIFMQLRYDNPINAMIVAFSLLGVGLFIGFTALDLTTRDRIYDFKAGQVVPGGTGVSSSGNKPLVQAARDRKIEALALELGSRQAALDEFQRQFDEHHHGHAAHPHPTNSNANQSRPKTGLSGALGAQSPTGGHAPSQPGAEHAAPAEHAPAH